MKRILVGIALSAMILGLAACGGQEDPQPAAEPQVTEPVEALEEPREEIDEQARIKAQQDRLYDAFTAFKSGDYAAAAEGYTAYLENARQTDQAEEIRNAFRRLITAYLELGTAEIDEELQPLYERFDRLTNLPTVADVKAEVQKARNTFSFNSIAELTRKYPWQSMGQGLLYYDVKEGDGPEVASGDLISCYYTLWNSKGEKLQSNKGSDPFQTVIDAGRLIKGWDMAVPGMNVGGIRRLIVPGELAYGTAPPDNTIEPNETLVFELQVVHAVQ